MDLEYIIRYEVESTAVDFKAIQYRKNDELLKDLIAMGNALVDQLRYVIVGVKLLPNGEREFLGIPEDEFVDDSTYQELVRTNVEPPLTFGYRPHRLDGKLFGIFEVGPCDDPPYMMRKDYAPHRHGDTWIRRGTSTTKLTRPDLDRILAKKQHSMDFADKLKVGFDKRFVDTVKLAYLSGAKLPSQKARETILQELEKIRANPNLPRFSFGMFGPGYGGMTYDQLEKALATVEVDYSQADYYYLLGQNSQEINITLFNAADRYLEDVTFELRFPRLKGLLIADTKPQRPHTSWDYMRASGPPIDPEVALYPQVEVEDDGVYVRHTIGDLRHGIPLEAFDVPVRITLGPVLEGASIELHYSVHARNLRAPITGVLRVVVEGWVSATGQD